MQDNSSDTREKSSVLTRLLHVPGMVLGLIFVAPVIFLLTILLAVAVLASRVTSAPVAASKPQQQNKVTVGLGPALPR